MGSHYYREIRRLLLDNGCAFVRNGNGDHEIWFSPISGATFVVDGGTKKKHTGNAALKSAGIGKKL